MVSGLKRWNKKGGVAGAAFLMATAAIGPGFITQTTVFTGQLFTSFGFAIIISIFIDIVVQLNVWRILVTSGKRAPELTNELIPGLGTFLVILVSLGGLIFNVGNIAGCSLALQSLFGISLKTGALLSSVIAIFIFLVKEFGKAMDMLTKVLGVTMILLMLYVAFVAHPPVAAMVCDGFFPDKINGLTIITLVGGTVGGYISFAGAHRLLDQGLKGPESVSQVNKGAVTGILLAGVMRILLFAAVAGVIATGFVLPVENPAAAVFQSAAGGVGLKIFGVILWSAAITSVVAAAYTSVSFLASVSAMVLKNQRMIIILFIIISAAVFTVAGSPTKLLIRAGTFNGLILPLALTCLLIVVHKRPVMVGYRHPLWLIISGWAVTLVLFGMGIRAIFLLFQDSGA